MIQIENDYKLVCEERERILSEMKKLEQEEIVKKYIELENQERALLKDQKELYKAMKKIEYSECNHVLVCTKVDFDNVDGRTYKYCGCIKCGLDESVFSKNNKTSNLKIEIKKEYLKKNGYFIRGRKLNVSCDLLLAQSIFNKINEVHPSIEENLAIKYFEIALDNIRKIEVNKVRRQSRARRLSLRHNFDKWYAEDIYN